MSNPALNSVRTLGVHHDKPGHTRDRIVAKMNERRSRWANTLTADEGYVCSQDRMSALTELASDLAPLSGDCEVSPIGDVEAPQGVKVGNATVFRKLDKATQVFRWAGEETNPENGRKMQRRFPDTSAAVDFVVQWMIYGVAPADAPAFFEVMDSFKDSPLFKSPEHYASLLASISRNFTPPGAGDPVSADEIEKTISSLEHPRTSTTPDPF